MTIMPLWPTAITSPGVVAVMVVLRCRLLRRRVPARLSLLRPTHLFLLQSPRQGLITGRGVPDRSATTGTSTINIHSACSYGRMGDAGVGVRALDRGV